MIRICARHSRAAVQVHQRQGRRLRQPPQPKQVRSALAELLAEGFAAKEMMSDEIYSGRSSNYWYIDLRHAVNVILLRVFEMKEILSQRQEAKAAHQARPVCVGCAFVCWVLC